MISKLTNSTIAFDQNCFNSMFSDEKCKVTGKGRKLIKFEDA